MAATARVPASLVDAIMADAAAAGDEELRLAAVRLTGVLARLAERHGFQPPSAPGLRFSREGEAATAGYLAREGGGGDWSAIAFGSEAQAPNASGSRLVHWRVPPAGGAWQPRLGKPTRDLESGSLAWQTAEGELVCDGLTGLSFVVWLYPTALAGQLRPTAPAFPDFLGTSLVHAAGRHTFAADAAAGLLTEAGGSPLGYRRPDAMCAGIDALCRKRRAEEPGDRLPRFGEALRAESGWLRSVPVRAKVGAKGPAHMAAVAAATAAVHTAPAAPAAPDAPAAADAPATATAAAAAPAAPDAPAAADIVHLLTARKRPGHSRQCIPTSRKRRRLNDTSRLERTGWQVDESAGPNRKGGPL